MKSALASFLLAVVTAIGCGTTTPQAGSRAPGSGSRELTVLPDHLEGRKWLERDAAVALSLGAGPLQVAVTEIAGDGDRVGGFVAIPADQCVLAYARGSQGIEDLDLYAYGDDGTTLASDEATDPQPALILCPPHPARAYLVARVAAGRGIVSIGVHALAPHVAAQVGKALGARGRPGEELGRIEPWPGLDEKVGAHRRLIGARWDEVRRVAIQADARASTRISATLDGGRCLDVYVVPGEEFAQLELAILDADDRVLVRAPSVGRDRSAILCSPVQISVSIDIRPHAGQGLCAVILARSDVGAERVIASPLYFYRVAPTAALAIERAQRAKPLRALGYADATAVGSGTADIGRRLSFPVALQEGCSRFDVIGGRPLAGIAADVWDASNTLLTSASSGAGPTMFACGKAGKGRIDVEALNRPGPFTIEMRRERAASPLLVSHPVAAGRLLAALSARGESITAQGAGDLKAVPLDPAAFKTFDLQLPDGRCGDIVAALDAGGSGIDMRIVDVETNEDFSSIRGGVVVETRACASGRARNLRGELRLSTGKSEALVAVRLAPLAPH